MSRNKYAHKWDDYQSIINPLGNAKDPAYFKEYAHGMLELNQLRCLADLPQLVFHKRALGPQLTTLMWYSRYWIWEIAALQILASNLVGVFFQVPESFSEEEAIRAWRPYHKRMKRYVEVRYVQASRDG